MRPLVPQGALARVLLSAVLGLAAGLLAILIVAPAVGVQIGIAVFSTVFAVTSLAVMWPLDADQTREHARREDLRPVLGEALVTLCCLGALTAIAVLAIRGDAAHTVTGALSAVVAVSTTWLALQIMFGARYAHAHYADLADGDSGDGFDLHSDQPPCFQDFLYIALSVGMTFGVTDTETTTTRARSVVLRQAVLSFAYAMVVIGVVVNLAASLLLG